jgi:hypothetical protein
MDRFIRRHSTAHFESMSNEPPPTQFSSSGGVSCSWLNHTGFSKGLKVPEPFVVALEVLGAGCLSLLRHRKYHRDVLQGGQMETPPDVAFLLSKNVFDLIWIECSKT